MNALVEAMVRTDVPSEEPDVDFDTLEQALRQIGDRFVDERTQGWNHPEKGPQAPVPKEQAMARWDKARQKFAEIMLRGRNNPDVNRRLRTGDKPGGRDIHGGRYRLARSTYSDPEGQAAADVPPGPEMDWQEYERGWNETPGERAMREEPSLRRGESKARQMIKQLIG